mmetsp:Transcript_21730/g.40708  ORF Transcript_21730/g.40708 Transcript_21730/m.40708 type:complete len:128 (-) Transcript_21730:674-1057(-)
MAMAPHVRAGEPLECFEERINHKKGAFASRGAYVYQIEHIFKHFPRENVHILFSDDLFSGEWDQRALQDFLGIEYVELDCAPSNTADASERSWTMSNETRATLQQVYDPLNEELFKLLGMPNRWKYN